MALQTRCLRTQSQFHHGLVLEMITAQVCKLAIRVMFNKFYDIIPTDLCHQSYKGNSGTYIYYVV